MNINSKHIVTHRGVYTAWNLVQRRRRLTEMKTETGIKYCMHITHVYSIEINKYNYTYIRESVVVCDERSDGGGWVDVRHETEIGINRIAHDVE